nr:hypothetical protein [uncultured Draconibacterium sp.]
MDKKAKEILFSTFWSSSGWKGEKKLEKFDFEYAKSKGLMFDTARLDHKELGDKIKSTYRKIDKKEIVKMFIASLASRRLEYRSFLSSFAVARVFEKHKFKSNENRFCNICGVFHKEKTEYDLNVMNFEKIKWGGVRLSHLEYVAFDLEQALSMEKIIPTDEDYKILDEIKKTILTSSFDDRPRQLEKRLAKIFKSNANEREVILNIFGICGILESDKQKGFFEYFIPAIDREIRPINKTDWSYPVDWWQGKFGINEKAWNYYFE